MNHSAATDFPSLCVQYIAISFFLTINFVDILQNPLSLWTHILFGLWFDLSKTFWKELVIVIPFLSFEGITQDYMLQISITHNKNLNPLLNLLINCICAKSAPQIFSIKNKCTFLLLNFLIIDLCNSLANSLIGMFSFLMLLPEVFLSKNL